MADNRKVKTNGTKAKAKRVRKPRRPVEVPTTRPDGEPARYALWQWARLVEQFRAFEERARIGMDENIFNESPIQPLDDALDEMYSALMAAVPTEW